MNALVYHSADNESWEKMPMPVIQYSTDAVVKMRKAVIYETDVPIMNGNALSLTEGRIVGNEGVGIIEEVGKAVSNFKKGDHVLIFSTTSCGVCANCARGLYSLCEKGGKMLGNMIDGTQAEYVRIPYAYGSLFPISADADEGVLIKLMLHLDMLAKKK